MELAKLPGITSGYTTSSLWGTTYVIDAWGNLTNMDGISGKTNSQSLQAAPASNNNQLGQAMSKTRFPATS